MKSISLELNEWQARLVLAAVEALGVHWSHINATSSDEDLVADVGNDLIKLQMIRDDIVRMSKTVYGEAMTEQPWTVYK